MLPHICHLSRLRKVPYLSFSQTGPPHRQHGWARSPPHPHVPRWQRAWEGWNLSYLCVQCPLLEPTVGWQVLRVHQHMPALTPCRDCYRSASSSPRVDREGVLEWKVELPQSQYGSSGGCGELCTHCSPTLGAAHRVLWRRERNYRMLEEQMSRRWRWAMMTWTSCVVFHSKPPCRYLYSELPAGASSSDCRPTAS